MCSVYMARFMVKISRIGLGLELVNRGYRCVIALSSTLIYFSTFQRRKCSDLSHRPRYIYISQSAHAGCTG